MNGEIVCTVAILALCTAVYSCTLTAKEAGDAMDGRCRVASAGMMAIGLRTPCSDRARWMRSAQIVLLAAVALLFVWMRTRE